MNSFIAPSVTSVLTSELETQVPLNFEPPKIAVRSVGVAFVFAQVQEQTS